MNNTTSSRNKSKLNVKGEIAMPNNSCLDEKELTEQMNYIIDDLVKQKAELETQMKVLEEMKESFEKHFSELEAQFKELKEKYVDTL